MFTILSVAVFATQAMCMACIPEPPPEANVYPIENGQIVELYGSHVVIKCSKFGEQKIWIEEPRSEAEILLGRYSYDSDKDKPSGE